MKEFVSKIQEKLKPLFNLLDDMNFKNTGVLAAGSAYFIVLAFFPFMAAVVAISSMLISADELGQIFSVINNYLPSDIASLVTTQLEAAQEEQATSVIFATIAVLIALFSVSGGVDNFSRGLNAVYGIEKTQSFIPSRIKSFLMTVGILVFFLMFGALLAANAGLLESIGLQDWVARVLSVLRWPLLVSLLFIFIGLIYKYAPERDNTSEAPWLSVGSMVAAILLAVFTALFFVYARYFANFSDSYSLFAGVIVLMLWCNLASQAILIGAHVDVLRRGKTVKKKVRKTKND